MADTKLKAYISSTPPELEEYRRAAVESLVRLGVEPLEPFSPEPLEATSDRFSSEFQISRLGRSDLFVGIYGRSYQLFSITEGAKSLVEIEYDAALEMRKPCFMYFMSETQLPTSKVLPLEADLARMERFKKKVAENSLIVEFTSAQDLSEHITKDISVWLANRGKPFLQSEEPKPVSQVIQPQGITSRSDFGSPTIVKGQPPAAQTVSPTLPNAPPTDQSKPQQPPAPTSTPSYALPLSASANQAIMRAEAFRIQAGTASLTSDFLLLGLIAESNAQAAIFLEAVGLSTSQAVQSRARQFGWKKIPDLAASPVTLTDPSVTTLDSIRRQAENIAKQKNLSDVSARNLLEGILALPDDPAYKWLNATLGQERVLWASRELHRRPENKPFALAEFPTNVRATYSDAATTIDQLGFEVQAQAIADIIKNRDTKPPVVIGVYGPWGSGKTTLMQLVRERLEHKTFWQTVRQHLKDENRNPALPNLLAVAISLRFQLIRAWIAKQPGRWHRRLVRMRRFWTGEEVPLDDSEPGLLYLWYNAWAYTDAAKLWAGLVQAISKYMDDQMTRWQRLIYGITRHTRRFLGAFLIGLIPVSIALAVIIYGNVLSFLEPSMRERVTVVITSVTALLGPAVILQVWRPLWDTVNGLTKKFDNSEMTGVVNKVQDEMKDVIRSYFSPQTDPFDLRRVVRQGKIKLVIFIDDLDRCPLNRIIDILEAIKLFLDEGIFIVLIAVDTRLASEAIRLYYEKVRNPELPREYLEKIVQIPVQVPQADEKSVKHYLESLMDPTVRQEETPAQASSAAPTEELGRPTDASPTTSGRTLVLPTPVGAAPTRPTPKRETAPDTSQAWAPIALPDTPEEYQKISELGVKYLESNPRRMKRLLYTYRYVKYLTKRASERGGVEEPITDEGWQKRMISWLAFSLAWPEYMQRAINEAEMPTTPPAEPFLLHCFDLFLERFPMATKPPGNPDLTKDDIRAHLNLSQAEVKKMARMASNFLIEYPLKPDEVAGQPQPKSSTNGKPQDVAAPVPSPVP